MLILDQTRSFFIAGTDTNVGKTWVTGNLARYFLEKKHTVTTQKWAQTGATREHGDMAKHYALMKQPQGIVSDLQCPYYFDMPAAPFIAAQAEGCIIETERITSTYQQLTAHYDHVIVEGIGGLMVPYQPQALIIDLVQALNLPTILVAANRLGAINHTLLSYEALQKRQIPVIAIVLNQCEQHIDPNITATNAAYMQQRLPKIPVWPFPYCTDSDQHYTILHSFINKLT